MDGVWLQRLCDHPGPLGACFLREYARALRLLSGLSRVGYLRALALARHQRLSEASRAAILNHRAVREFTSFVRSFQPEEVPVVCEVLTQHLFPDAPVRGLFQAARLDPLVDPEGALASASRELEEVENLIRPEVEVLDEPPGDRHFPEGYTWPSERWAAVVAGMDCTLLPPELLPSMISGVAGTGFSQVPDFRAPVETQVVSPQFSEYEREKRRRRRQIISENPAQSATAGPSRVEQDEMPIPVAASSVKPDPEDNLEGPVETPMDDTMEPVGHLGDNKTASPAPAVPEFEEVTEEPLHHPTPATGVPEPLLPPRKREAEVEGSGRARKRASRWDPEVTEGFHGSGTSAAADSPVVPRFQLVFLPPTGLPQIQVPQVTRIVSQLQAVLRQDPPQAVTIVISRPRCDPMSFANVTDFGALLQAFALRSKLSLLSYGKAWTLKYQDKEKSQGTTTLFLEVVQVSAPSDHPTTRPKTLPGPRRPNRSRSPPRRKPPRTASGPSGPSKPAETGKRPVFRSHGKQRNVALHAAGPEFADAMRAPALHRGPENVATVYLEADVAATLEVFGRELPSLRESCNPGFPCNGIGSKPNMVPDDAIEVETEIDTVHSSPSDNELSPGLPPVPKEACQVSPTLSFQALDPAVPEFGSRGLTETPAVPGGFPVYEDGFVESPGDELLFFPDDGRQHVSLKWIQQQALPVQELLSGIEPGKVLGRVRGLDFCELGGFLGVTLIGKRCTMQLHPHLISPKPTEGGAYKVSPSCPACGVDIPLATQVHDCPQCGVWLRSFKLPAQAPQTLTGTAQTLGQFKTHHPELGKRTGTFNAQIQLLEIFQGAWFAETLEQEPVWILIPPALDPFVRPRIGHLYYVFQAICVGRFDQVPILLAPSPTQAGALVRQCDQDAEPRSLEMFAGIGGWYQAQAALLKQPRCTFSVEIDPVPAAALAKSTSRPCLSIGDWQCDPHLHDVVIVGDVRDPSWWLTTLSGPFTDMLFSAPCIPWSQAGLRKGLDSSDGQLLIWVAALVVVFRVQWALGENVKGLLNHPHWPEVLGVFQATGLECRVFENDLASFGVMRRERSFLALTNDKMRDWPKFPVAPTSPVAAGVYMNRVDAVRTEIPQKALEILALRRFLPDNLLQIAYDRKIPDGPQVLGLRVHTGSVLPTLVASYRTQTALSKSHLEARGVFTWLLESERPRFLDPFEGARALGFAVDTCLPSDLDAAMHAVGNAISPIQALLALCTTAPLCQVRSDDEICSVLQCWTTGCVSLAQMQVVEFGGLSRLVERSIVRSIPSTKLRNVVICCDGHVYPLPLSAPLLPDCPGILTFFPLGGAWPILEIGRVFTEDTLAFVFRVCPLRISFRQVAGLKTCLLSPFSCLRDVIDVLSLQAFQVSDIDAPIWTWRQQPHWKLDVVGDEVKWLPSEVLFSAAQEVRMWTFQDGCSFHQVAEVLFPRCSAGGVAVQDAATEEFLDIQFFPTRGAAYRFHFMPVRVLVEPHGYFMIDPLASVRELGDLINFQIFAGRASVHVCVNGSIATSDLHVALAQQLGVLRAKVYALPGGAFTLNTVLEDLQSLLVQHGHPASSAHQKSNQVVDKLGAKLCHQVLTSKHPWAVLKSEATKHDVVLVPAEHRGHSSASKAAQLPDLAEDPWANWGDKRRESAKPKKPQEKQAKLATKVDLSFFHVKGAPLSPLDLPQLLQGVSGVHVTTFADFQPHLDVVLANNVSVGPAAVLLLGSVPADIFRRNPNQVKEVVVPGWIGTHPAAIRAVVLQVGDDPVEFHSVTTLNVATAPSPFQVVQVHIYRADCDKWEVLAEEGLESFLKALGFASLCAVANTWSCDFYTRGRKTSPTSAIYFHGFLKLEQTKVESLLKLGGISGFFPSPRSEMRGPDPRYRSLLLRGMTPQEARKVLASHPTAVGLTRTRQGLGLRVLAQDYDDVKKKVFPQSLDSSESDEGGARKFQLLGVPQECGRPVLKQALKALGWTARVSKSSGFRAWAVFSQQDPPTRAFPLLQATVVIAEQQSATLGTIAGSTLRKPPPGLSVQVDTVVAASPGTLPTEKFAQLEEKANAKVAVLEQRVDALAAQVSSQNEQVNTKIDQVAHDVQGIEHRFSQQLDGMFTKFLQCQQKSFGELEAANKAAISTLRNEYNTGYTELKELLANSPKARRVGEGAAP